MMKGMTKHRKHKSSTLTNWPTTTLPSKPTLSLLPHAWLTGFVQSHDVIPEACATCSDEDASTHVLTKLLAELRRLEG